MLTTVFDLITGVYEGQSQSNSYPYAHVSHQKIYFNNIKTVTYICNEKVIDGKCRERHSAEN